MSSVINARESLMRGCAMHEWPCVWWATWLQCWCQLG